MAILMTHQLADSVQIRIETPDLLATIANRILGELKTRTKRLLE